MMTKVRSLSKCGAIIDQALALQNYRINQGKLSKLLESKMNINRPKKKAVIKQGFDSVPGRECINSFQRYNTKDTSQFIYENRKDVVLPRSASYSVKKDNRGRLEHLKPKEDHSMNPSCNKYKETPENERIKTTRDLQQHRKTFHSLDLNKQSFRPFDQTIRKLTIKASEIGNQDIKQPPNTILRAHSVHGFGSYTRREFLNQKYVSKGSQTSGIDCYKINPQKFKGNWKVVGSPSFEKVPRRHLSRYDSDCPPWHTKLTYNIKETQKVRILSFGNQADRCENLVKSSYPIRIAI